MKRKNKDTERLNWLEKNARGIGHSCDRKKTIWCVEESWYYREPRYSLRAAIDAAMKKFP